MPGYLLFSYDNDSNHVEMITSLWAVCGGKLVAWDYIEGDYPAINLFVSDVPDVKDTARRLDERLDKCHDTGHFAITTYEAAEELPPDLAKLLKS